MYREGRHSEAIKAYTEIMTKENDPAFHVERGMVFQAIGQHDKAIQDFSSAINDYGDWNGLFVARYQRAISWNALEVLSSALEDCSISIDLSPEFPHAYYLRAKVSMQKKDFDAAQIDLVNALRIEKGLIEAHFALAECCAAVSDWDNVILHANLYIRSPGADPRYIWRTYCFQAQALEAKRDFSGAFISLTNALSVSPKKAMVLARRARISELLGNHNEARRDLKEASNEL